MTRDEWKKGTSLVFKPRSKLMEAIDAALGAYQQTQIYPHFRDVGKALSAWQASKGPPSDAWKKSDRNKNLTISLLDSQLNKLGDSDVGLGAQSFMQPELVNAREGMLYLYSHIDIDANFFSIFLESGLDIAANGMSLGSESIQGVGEKIEKIAPHVVGLSDMAETKLKKELFPNGANQLVGSVALGQAVSPPTNPAQSSLYVKIVDYLKEWARELWDTICAKFKDIKNDPLMFSAEFLNKMVMNLGLKVLAALVPFVGAAKDIVVGLVATGRAALTKFNEWTAGRNVDVLAGSPATIIEAIKRAMWFSVGEGLYTTLKGTANLAVQASTKGAGVIVSAVIAIIEVITKTIWKIIEILRMKSFFRQARDHWLTRGNGDALHTQPVAFNAWFKSYALDIPVLSVLALNSGICGDKMRFLNMFKSDNSIVDQSAFDKGVTYVDGLKAYGATYLDKCGFKFISKDPLCDGLLKLGTSHSAAPQMGDRASSLLGALIGA